MPNICLGYRVDNRLASLRQTGALWRRNRVVSGEENSGVKQVFLFFFMVLPVWSGPAKGAEGTFVSGRRIATFGDRDGSQILAKAAAQTEAQPSASATAADKTVSEPTQTRVVIPNLDAAVEELFREGEEVVRVVVVPTRGTDEARTQAVSQQIVRVILDRGREEVVTPALVRAALDTAASQMEAGQPLPAMQAMAADHVCFSEVVEAGGEVNLKLRLVEVKTGAIRGEKTTPILLEAGKSSLRAADGRARLRQVADELMWGIQQLPGEIRYQRIAVLPLQSTAAEVKNAKVDRFVQAELSEQLAARGFLLVERNQLDQTIEQMTLGAVLGEENAPEVGKMLDTQALILGGIGVAGDVFTVSLRAVNTETGQVLSSSATEIPREGVVALAEDAIELRTPEEALFRSLVAPGWGQFYNQAPTKGMLFGGLFYGTVVSALGLGVAGLVSEQMYRNYKPAAGVLPEVASQGATLLREQTNVIYSAGIVSASISAVAWSLAALDAYLLSGSHP